MVKWTSKEIRQKWLTFFEEKGHLVVPSKSLVPKNDNSLLWINSGVATLKEYFSGKKTPPCPRLANSQKALRTNDIENVGVTSRHHTFFEMLGNFSIGDYFKKEAIDLAFELLFNVFKFVKSRIYITYFAEDSLTYDLWIKKGIDKNNLVQGGRKTNFWDMGQGPCGPDTEIFYDRGKKFDPANKGLKLLENDEENDRYVEIWNIVFSEFNNDGKNNYQELAQKNIDTGAGLERFVAILQNGPTTYDTDLFLPIIRTIEKFTNFKYDSANYFRKNKKQTQINTNFRIIADHIRGVTMAIQDGVLPSNVSRGYIIRRLIRRAYRAKIQLQIPEKNLLDKLVAPVAKTLGCYEFNVKGIESVIRKEEDLFAKTISQGERILNKVIENKKEVNLKLAFNLYQTFGLPIEITQEILEAKNIFLDVSNWKRLLEKHADASSDKNNETHAMTSQINVINTISKKCSTFVGYDKTSVCSKVIFSEKENGFYYTLAEKTPFYATSGGQERDKGTISGIAVVEVFKDKYQNVWHVTKEKVVDTQNQTIALVVEPKTRSLKAKNHSGTHLLVAAIKEATSYNITQQGSYNDEFKIRLDFEYPQPFDARDVAKIERTMQKYIKQKIPRNYLEVSLEQAKKMRAVGLATRTYSNKVRLVQFGETSLEYCGGTHVKNSSEIEDFKITKYESKGLNIKRVEAITSFETVQKFKKQQKLKLKESLKKQVHKNKELNPKYDLEFLENVESMQKALDQAKMDFKRLVKQGKKVSAETVELETREIGNQVFLVNLNIGDFGSLKPLAVELRNKNPNQSVLLASQNKNKTVVCLASVTLDARKEITRIFPSFQGGGSKTFVMGSIKEREIKA